MHDIFREWYVLLFRIYRFKSIASNPIFAAVIFLATRASHERSQKAPTEFPACFLARFLSVAIGGRQWRAEERFRNSYMHSLHPHIHRRFFARQSTIFERTEIPDYFLHQVASGCLPSSVFRRSVEFLLWRKKDLIGQCFSKIYIIKYYIKYIWNNCLIVPLILCKCRWNSGWLRPSSITHG